MKKRQAGFTLIELLVVIGILAVLLAIVLVAINPDRQFKQANDTQRSSDVNAILNAVTQYGADHKGDLTALYIPQSDDPADAEEINATNSTDLCGLVVPLYIAALPGDPTTSTGAPVTDCTVAGWTTGYTIRQNLAGRITVTATPQLATSITVTR